jgi:hypothetical protein
MRTAIYSTLVMIFGLAATSTADTPDRCAVDTQAQAKPEKPLKPPAIDKEAIAALEKTGAFLREQKSFTVGLHTETDFVLDNGQKVRAASRGEIRARRPDHLRADVVSDRKDRSYYYDGKEFTIYGKRTGFYSTVPAPPTIKELAETLEERYGLQFPMVDLFRWGGPDSRIDEITHAAVVGKTKVDGVETTQYAFRQPGLDWQVWIEDGPRPVPRKLVLTTTDDPARPEHAVEMTWDLNARHDDAVFAFDPPADSAKIPLAEFIPQGKQAQRSARK